MAKRLTAKTTIRNGADQERHESVRGGSPDRRDSEACKEAWTEFCATGSSHVPKTHGQPAIRPSENKMRTVPDKHKREDAGILRIAMNL